MNNSIIIKDDQRNIVYSEHNPTYTYLENSNNIISSYDLEAYHVQHSQTSKKYFLRKLKINDFKTVQHKIKELQHAAKLNHQGLLKIFDYYIEKQLKDKVIIGYTINIIFSEISHTLFDEIAYRKAIKKPFTPNEINDIFCQLVETLYYLQNNECYHGDIKPVNIYLTKDGEYKLCYLGYNHSNLFDEMSSSLLSSVSYLSPHKRDLLASSLILGKQYYQNVNSEIRSDVFSLGLTILNCITLKGVLGMNGVAMETKRFEILKDLKKKHHGHEIFDILEMILIENHYLRPDFIYLKQKSPILKPKIGKILLKKEEIKKSGLTNRLIQKSQILDPSNKDVKEEKIDGSEVEMKLFADLSEEFLDEKSHRDSWFTENQRYNSSILNWNESFLDTGSKNMNTGNLVSSNRLKKKAKFYTKNDDLVKSSRFLAASNKPGGISAKASILILNKEQSILNKNDINREIHHSIHDIIPEKKNDKPYNDMSQIKEEPQNTQGIFLGNEEENIDPYTLIIDDEEKLKSQKILEYKKIVINLDGISKSNERPTLLDTIYQAILNSQNMLETLIITMPKAELGDNGLTNINIQISKMTTIKTIFLELRRNNIGNEGLFSISKIFTSANHLISIGLDLASNLIDHIGAKELANGLKSCVHMTSLALNLGNNDIGNEGLISLSKSISELMKLDSLVLYFYGNNIDDEGIHYLLERFNDMSALLNLIMDFSDNIISENVLIIIMNFLKKVKTLENFEIDLKNNLISETANEFLNEINKLYPFFIINLF